MFPLLNNQEEIPLSKKKRDKRSSVPPIPRWRVILDWLLKTAMNCRGYSLPVGELIVMGNVDTIYLVSFYDLEKASAPQLDQYGGFV